MTSKLLIIAGLGIGYYLFIKNERKYTSGDLIGGTHCSGGSPTPKEKRYKNLTKVIPKKTLTISSASMTVIPTVPAVTPIESPVITYYDPDAVEAANQVQADIRAEAAIIEAERERKSQATFDAWLLSQTTEQLTVVTKPTYYDSEAVKAANQVQASIRAKAEIIEAEREKESQATFDAWASTQTRGQSLAEQLVETAAKETERLIANAKVRAKVALWKLTHGR